MLLPFYGALSTLNQAKMELLAKIRVLNMSDTGTM
jgi:hypothetical protein